MILVTGGTGLLGSHLLVELTKSTNTIRAIYRSEKRLNAVENLFQFYLGDSYLDSWKKIEWVCSDCGVFMRCHGTATHGLAL